MEDNVESKFNTSTTCKTVSTIIMEASDPHIMDLRPAYQRGEVWKDAKRSVFINSVIRGIVPNCLIFNRNESGKLICIDGQQRITSLVKFRNNDIPVEIDNEIIFYDKINPIYNKKSIVRIMKPIEKTKFNSKNIPVVEYYNLSYEDQIDIFNRIQNGMALSKGEMVASKFVNENFSKIFIKFCNDNYKIVAKFTDKKRQNHVRYISHIFYILNNKNIKIPSSIQEDNFIKEIKNVTVLNNYLKYTEKVLKCIYGKNILGDIDIKKNNLSQNILLTFIMFVRDEITIDSIDSDKEKNLCTSIKKTIKECMDKNIGIKKNNDTIVTIYNIIKKYFVVVEKDNEDSEDDDSDIESEFSESSYETD